MVIMPSGGGGVIFDIIGDFAQYVKLFFIISGFALCCGYYDRFKENRISLKDFYGKRYMKILPFFALLIFIDIAVALVLGGGVTPSTLYEAFANLTLTFGFLPDGSFSVVGVGWTLGVIFGFYIIFPFFVYLIWNKKRAWISFVISLLMTMACEYYFLVDGHAVAASMIRWLSYFILGGLIYLYRDNIKRLVRNPIVGFSAIIAGWCIVYLIPVCLTGTPLDSFVNNIRLMVGFGTVLCGAFMPDNTVLSNRVTKFVSSISFEIYLSHMVIFRVIEKMGLVHIVDNDLISFIIVSVAVTAGTIVFACIYKMIEKFVFKKLIRQKEISA